MKKTTVAAIIVFVIIATGIALMGFYARSNTNDKSSQTDSIATYIIEKKSPFETKWSVQYFASITPEQNPVTESINLHIAKAICGTEINLENNFETILEESFLNNYMDNIPIIQSEEQSEAEHYESYGTSMRTGNMGFSDARCVYLTGEFIPIENQSNIVCYKLIFNHAYNSRFYPIYFAYSMETGNEISLSDVIGGPVYKEVKQSSGESADKKSYTTAALKLKILIAEELIKQHDLLDYSYDHIEGRIYDIELIDSFYLTKDGIVFAYDGVMFPNSPRCMWGTPYNVTIPYKTLIEQNIAGDIIRN